jgi:hypothetical protein
VVWKRPGSYVWRYSASQHISVTADFMECSHLVSSISSMPSRSEKLGSMLGSLFNSSTCTKVKVFFASCGVGGARSGRS